MSVFISYRRGVTQDIVGRLRDRLKHSCAVFQDIESIRAGTEFTPYTTRALRESAVVLVVIGPDWRSAGDLEDERDWVRVEVQLALEQAHARVIPVLVGGAELPSESELPGALRPLLLRQALRVDSGADFELHASRLLAELALPAPSARRNLRGWSIALGTLAVGLLIVAYFAHRSSSPAVGAEVSAALPAHAEIHQDTPLEAPQTAAPAPSGPPVLAPSLAHSPTASQPPEAAGYATEAELRAAVLACWTKTEGGEPTWPASSAVVVLDRGLNMKDTQSPAFATSPRFTRCVNALADTIWERVNPRRELRIRMLLPGRASATPFPTQAQARAELLKCWQETQDDVSKGGARVLTFKVDSSGGTCWVKPAAPHFLACASALFDSYKARASLLDSLGLELSLPEKSGESTGNSSSATK